jgi:hypothetical protein
MKPDSSEIIQPAGLKCPQCGANIAGGQEEEFTICQYCGSCLVWSLHNSLPNSAVRGIRLHWVECTDSEGTGLKLFRMLAPVGWQLQGGVRWLLDNPGMPATVAVQVGNPQGAEAFEILPNMNFTWSNNPMTRMTVPKGSRYFGAEVCPLVDIHQAFTHYVIPRFRSSCSNLQVIKEEPVPDLPRLVKSEAPLVGGTAEGGRIRIGFSWQNFQFEEEIYGVVESFRAPIASVFGTTEILIWFIDYLFSFRAAAGRLDKNADLFGVMLRSFQLNPEWYAAFKCVAQYLASNQIQRIRHIGQIGEIYAQTGRQMREENLNNWYSRQRIYDRISVDRSRAIRDMDGFFDPHKQEVVELPSGYGHAWANNLGEYIVTEDSTFNPNVDSNLHWEPMQAQ